MKKILLALSLPYLLSAHTIPELFDALKSHAQTKSDEMAIKQAEVAKEMANAKLYPTINLFTKYDYTSEPVGMIPVPPDTLVKLVVDPSKPAQPFSQNTFREGANFTMPLFVKSIYTMSAKAQKMQKSAEAKKKINLLKNEAVIVGANANYLYLVELDKSLDLKKKSLLETQKTIKIKVDNGRAPASALYKIDDSINQIDITKNSIALQKEQLINSIRSLTGITLEAPIPMQEVSTVQTSDDIKSLAPLKLKIEANRLDVDAQKEKLYPSIVAYGSYSFSQAKAYNNNENVNETYGNLGVVLNIPLLAMEDYQGIKKSKIQMHQDEVEYEKLEEELSSKAKMLQNSLPLLENSIKLSQKSIKNKEKLLDIAKVNYMSGRLSTEEYLRYEDDVVAASAELYKTEAQKWQTLMELAVIYANNIEEIVK
ncbi:MAG: TolC family protein [Epsilonproteobacteria bacterium]|nr:TolC family protein [Campylobacterota bacterium]